MEVTPILITQIDFPALLRAGRQGTGRTLTHVLDKVGQPIGSPLSLLAILGAVEGKGFTLNDAAVHEAKNLQHLFFGFAVSGEFEDINSLIRFLGGRLATTINNQWTFAVLSGSLDQWKPVILEGIIDPVVSQVFISIKMIFGSYGLGPIWSE